MAGPAAAVLLSESWTAGNIEEFHEWLASWLPPPPDDAITVEVESLERYDADEAAYLKQALGYLPATEVVLTTAVNGPEDHRLLARLAIAVARRYHGLIDLDALLPAGGPDWKERSRTTIEALPGRWHEIHYRVGDRIAAYHVVDPELLTAWLEHPQFRMVK